jgi:hypothetical protein
MWAIIRWLKLRRYHAKLSFTTQEVNLNGLQDELPKDKDGWVHIDGKQ